MLNNSQYYQCNYRCVVCNLYFNTFEQQKHHYYTYHSRTVDQNPYPRSTQNPYPRNIPNQYRQQPQVMKRPRVQPIKCEVCGIDCSSPSAYELHISGKKHLKAVSKMENSNLIGGSNGAVIEIVKPEDTAVKGAVIQQAQVLYRSGAAAAAGQSRCEACSVTCLQPEQLARHLEGARHKRKMKMIEFMELKARKDPAVYCDKCDSFMTEDSMVNHLKSGKHKRKSTDKMTDEPAEKKSKNADIPTTVEYCGFCDVQIKNATEAVTHYQTQKHSLNMVNRSKNYDLWCDVCQTSFANQQFHDSHMKGFKHFTKVNRGNDTPEGELGGRLMKMREKMKSLKHSTKMRKTTYADKYTFIPNQPPNPVNVGNGSTEVTTNPPCPPPSVLEVKQSL